jgi:hypothetical protein
MSLFSKKQPMVPRRPDTKEKEGVGPASIHNLFYIAAFFGANLFAKRPLH